MKYIQIPGDPNAVAWQDNEGNSGIIRQGDEGWEAYRLWLSEGNTLVSLAPEDSRSLEELRQAALMEVNASADVAMLPITTQYPRAEIDSWPEQCTEARGWMVAPQTETLLIDTITGPVDEADKRAFCERLLAKVNDYKLAIGTVIAWRREVTGWVLIQTDRNLLINFVPKFPEVPSAS